MDEKIARELIAELKKHPGLIPVDEQLFLDTLVRTEVPESSRFYETLENVKQFLQETDDYSLSLRRVLRNRNAESCRLSGPKRLVGSVASRFGVYSSDHLTRSLRANLDLVDMMGRCENPFSLLGKLQTFDYEGSGGILYVMTMPVLIIPDVKDTSQIHVWEERNTRYEKEVGILKHLKRISQKEYLAHT